MSEVSTQFAKIKCMEKNDHIIYIYIHIFDLRQFWDAAIDITFTDQNRCIRILCGIYHVYQSIVFDFAGFILTKDRSHIDCSDVNMIEPDTSVANNKSTNTMPTKHNPLLARKGTVETLYNTVNFCWSTHKRHSIARPKGRGMGCLLWVQKATYCVDLSNLSSIKYLL